MSTLFKPYEGRLPYVFISYSHRDSERVLEIISALNDRKLRLWYDEGIPAGSDWPKNIELHMRGCAAVLFFVSETALASPNCYSEISTAVRTGKPVLTVPLEPTSPDDAWKKLLPPGPQTGMTVEEILLWKVLRRSFYRKWSDAFRREWIGLGAAVLLLSPHLAGLEHPEVSIALHSLTHLREPFEPGPTRVSQVAPPNFSPSQTSPTTLLREPFPHHATQADVSYSHLLLQVTLPEE